MASLAEGTAPARRIDPTSRLLDLGDLREILRRRWYVLVLTTMLMLALALVVGRRMHNVYDATSRLKLDSSQGATLGTLFNPTEGDDNAVQTEIEQIRSQAVVEGVARRLDMPEVRAAHGAVPQKVVDWLLRDLTIDREDGTYVVDISYRGRNPDWAAQVVNAFVAEYLQQSVGRRTYKAGRTEGMLKQRMVALDREVRAADDRVARFRAENGIPRGVAQLTIADQQIGPTVFEAASAASRAAQLRSTLASARAQQGAGRSDSITRVNDAIVSTDLAAARTALLKQQESVLERYGPRHPEAVRIAGEIASIDRQIKEQQDRAIAALESTAHAADASAATLRGQVDAVQRDQAANSARKVEADALQQDADAKRSMYYQLAAAAELAGQDRRDQEPKAVIVDIATPPDLPSWPNMRQLVVLGVLSGGMLGLFIIMVPELLRGGLRSEREVEEQLGLPFLAVLPAMKRPRRLLFWRTERKVMTVELRADPLSAAAESLRMVRAQIVGQRARRVIAVSSAEPMEGRSTAAAALAEIMAMSGDRIALIGQVPADCPRIALSSLLDGRAAIDPILLRDRLDQLSPSYDLVLIDTPPVMSTSDALLLAASADATVLVVRWSRTRTRVVQEALARLKQVQVDPIGVVLTRARDPFGSSVVRRFFALFRPIGRGWRALRYRTYGLYFRWRPRG